MESEDHPPGPESKKEEVDEDYGKDQDEEKVGKGVENKRKKVPEEVAERGGVTISEIAMKEMMFVADFEAEIAMKEMMFVADFEAEIASLGSETDSSDSFSAQAKPQSPIKVKSYVDFSNVYKILEENPEISDNLLSLIE